MIISGDWKVVNDGVMGGNSKGDWKVVNDGVMGGVSQGGMSDMGNVMLFEGYLSLENNGGFSSVQVKPDPILDLGEYDVSLKNQNESLNIKKNQLKIWIDFFNLKMEITLSKNFSGNRLESQRRWSNLQTLAGI